MADTKASALTPITPVLTDTVYAVDDPGGTPVSAVATLQAIMDLFEANIVPQSLYMPERADHAQTPTAGSGELWVSNDATQKLQFTDDAGTDKEVAFVTGGAELGAYTGILGLNSGTAVDVDTAAKLVTRVPDLVGQQHIWWPANAMTPSTTNGAAAGTVETTTNDVMIETLDFDAATDEFAQFSIQMPKNWDEGTLVVSFVWSHPSTATNFDAVWGCQAVAFADGDALDTAWGTAVTVTDTGGTTDDLYITAETSAMTVAGTPGAEEVVYFRVYRDANAGGDTLAVDARLHGIKVHWTNDAMTVA